MADSDGDGTPDDVDEAPYDASRKGRKQAAAPAASAAPGGTPPGPRTDSGLFNADGTHPVNGQVEIPKTQRPDTTSKFAYWPQDPANIHVNTSDPQGILNASYGGSPTYNKMYPQADANLKWDSLDPKYQAEVTKLQKSKGGRSGSALWEKAVAISEMSVREGNPKTPFQVLAEMGLGGGSGGNGPGGGSGPGSGSGSGSGGPTSSVSYAAAPDVRAIADGVAQEMLGRVVTDAEMKRILKRVRAYEANNPSVSQSSGVSSVSMAGATNAGRQDVVKRLMVQNPDFMPYQMDHTVYDAMLSVMKQGEGIANG